MFSRIAILKPLQHRPFRLLFAGQVISDLGDWLDILAVITLIAYRWDLGAGALAALSITLAIPWAFIAPVSGVWVDRWPRKTTMIASDLIRAVVVLGLIGPPISIACWRCSSSRASSAPFSALPGRRPSHSTKGRSARG